MVSNQQCSELTEMADIGAQLGNADIWRKCHNLGNEQILTKPGRCLFPNFWISLDGLKADVQYFVCLEIKPSDNKRYKFYDTEWYQNGESLMHKSKQFYSHPKCPAFGGDLVYQPLIFNHLRISNTESNNNNVVLCTMHKYVIQVHVIQADHVDNLLTGPRKTIIFPETEFMAVTSYKNKKIRDLKIALNPRAKSIHTRLSNQMAKKRKHPPTPPPEPKSDPADTIKIESAEHIWPTFSFLNDFNLTDNLLNEFMSFGQFSSLLQSNPTIDNIFTKPKNCDTLSKLNSI